MISRGQIYLVNLDPVHGRGQKGVRPVLVVSADAISRQPLVVTVVAGTDATRVSRDYPTNIRVPARQSGLRKTRSSSASSSGRSIRRASGIPAPASLRRSVSSRPPAWRRSIRRCAPS